MTVTTVLTVIGGTVLIIGAAARLPHAVAELIRSCIPVVTALHELRSAAVADAARSHPPAQLPEGED
ncbi:hypothetical protein GCM10009603_07320 [Nocardiopsis exhalans]